MNAVNWIVANWQQIVIAVSGIMISARIIVKLTPTPKDDSILEKVIDFLKHVGLNVPPPSNTEEKK